MKISVTQCTGIGTQYKGKKICKIFVGNKLIPITTNHLYNSLGAVYRLDEYLWELGKFRGTV